MKKYSIQNTITQSILWVIVIPFIILCVLPSLLTYWQFQQQMINESQILLNTTEAELDTFIEKTNKEFTFLKNNLVMNGASSTFNSSIDFSNFFQNIYRVELLNNKGKVTANMPINDDVIGFDKSLSYDFTTAHMNNNLFDGRIFYDTSIDAPSLSWGTKMENGSVLVAYLNLNALNKFLVQSTSSLSHSVALIDNKGTYIANSNPTHVYTRNVDSFYNEFINGTLALDGSENLRLDGKTVTPIGKILPERQWILVTYANKDTFNQSLLPFVITYFVFSIITSSILIYLIRSKLTRMSHSIIELSSLTQAFVEGELDDPSYDSPFQEIERIYLHFMTLVNDSTNRIREYTTLNNDLETKIIERTIALENSIAALKAAQEELIQKEKVSSMVTLTSGITQEMNTPLSIASTLMIHLKENVDALTEGNVNEKQEELLASMDVLERNLQYIASLLGRFKNMTGYYTSENKDIFNLDHLLSNLQILHSPLLERHDTTMTHSASESFRIKGDPGIFEQIFSLLIVNSIEHGFKDRQSNHIDILLSKKNNTLNIDYIDNGKGINHSHQAKVFDPFFTTTRDNGNIGIGLSTLYSLITNTLGGEVKLTSMEDKGVQFRISIPLIGEENIAGFYRIEPLEALKS